jgi:hypothetical protein
MTAPDQRQTSHFFPLHRRARPQQSTVEAVPLRPSGGHTPRSTASSTTVPMTARSAGLPPRQRPTRPHRDRLLYSRSPASGRSQAPRPCTAAAESSNPHNIALVARGIVHGRFPYAGPDAPPAMAGIRKPSPLSPFPVPDAAPESTHHTEAPLQGRVRRYQDRPLGGLRQAREGIVAATCRRDDAAPVQEWKLPCEAVAMPVPLLG